MVRLFVLLCLAVASAGCIVKKTEVVRIRHADGSTPAGPAAGPGPADHVVARGETLYSIAFRSGLDWRQVAAWNRLPEPYTIYPGQRLRLSAPAATSAPSGPAVATAPPASGPAETRPVTDDSTASPPSPPPTAPPPASPPATPSTPPVEAAPVAAAPPPAPDPEAPAPGIRPPATIDQAATTTVGGIAWRWPTQGELIQRYRADDLTRQGIGIAGRSGQAVVAAADGEVVYSGSGLRGYGELIIVKHSADYLSAYGHNRRRLVNEGERVRAGQPIAELGRTGADRDKLHFEIRRSGKPVDPMTYLPRR